MAVGGEAGVGNSRFLETIGAHPGLAACHNQGGRQVGAVARQQRCRAGVELVGMFEATNAAAQGLTDRLRSARVGHDIGVVLPRGPHGTGQLPVAHFRSRNVLAFARQAPVDKNLDVVGSGLELVVGCEVKPLLTLGGYACRSGSVTAGSSDCPARPDEPGRFGPTPLLGISQPQVCSVLFMDAAKRGNSGVECVPGPLSRPKDCGRRALGLVRG